MRKTSSDIQRKDGQTHMVKYAGKEQFAKSPLNYTGGKHKLLPKIVPLIPTDGENMTFIDLFGGGGNVSANAPANYSKIVYNELNENVLSLVKYLVDTGAPAVAKHVDARIKEYSLSRTGKDEFIAFRTFYNEQDEPRDVGDLFTLVAHAFSNQIRFNRKGEFNLPFGKRTFNDSMRANLYAFARAWTDSGEREDTVFSGLSFADFDFAQYAPDSTFIYCDPPYLGSVATYNERDGWTAKNEELLLKTLDELHERGYRWMLSNNLEYDNPLLDKWIADNADKYTMIDMKHDYKNCNYHKNAALIDSDDDDASNEKKDAIKEIVVINYQISE